MSYFREKARLGGLVVFSILLIFVLAALAFPRYERVFWWRQMVITIVTPPRVFVTAVQRFFADTWNHYIAISDAAKQNEELIAWLHALNARLIEFEDVKKENQRLRGLLSMTESLKVFDPIGAEVITSNPLAETRSVTINKGLGDGIKKNMAVVSPGGLVGKIALVSAKEATVLLISDPNTTVDAFIQRSGARVLVNGTFHNPSLRPFLSLSRLEYLTRTSDIEEEDIIVTSGMDQLYPRGIPIGTVHNLEKINTGIFREAELVPFVDFGQMREVVILRPMRGAL